MILEYYHTLNIMGGPPCQSKDVEFQYSLNSLNYFDLNLCLCILGKDLLCYLNIHLNLLSHFILDI